MREPSAPRIGSYTFVFLGRTDETLEVNDAGNGIGPTGSPEGLHVVAFPNNFVAPNFVP